MINKILGGFIMRNIELTKDQNYRLEQSKFYYGDNDYQNLILKHYLGGSLTELEWEDLTFLYKFKIEELMNILLGNYEVKKTPEEIFLKEYENLEKIVEKSGNLIKVEKAKDAIFTINKTLEILEIKIKGVNC